MQEVGVTLSKFNPEIRSPTIHLLINKLLLWDIIPRITIRFYLKLMNTVLLHRLMEFKFVKL